MSQDGYPWFKISAALCESLPVTCATPKISQKNKHQGFSRGIFFFNWYSLHARLSSHYKAWSYKKRKHKKIKAYRKSI